MSTNTATNGRPQRKQLSDQLDRLDGIIDALADGLNGAVAGAAREGSRAAVKEILTELLTNPDVLAMIRSAAGPGAPAPAAPVPVVPSPPPATGGFVAAAVDTVAHAVKAVVNSVTARAAAAWGVVRDLGRAVCESPRLKKTLLIGAGIGLATAAVAATNHTVAAALSGVGAAATAVAVQVGCWFRGAGRRLGLAWQ